MMIADLPERSITQPPVTPGHETDHACPASGYYCRRKCQNSTTTRNRVLLLVAAPLLLVLLSIAPTGEARRPSFGLSPLNVGIQSVFSNRPLLQQLLLSTTINAAASQPAEQCCCSAHQQDDDTRTPTTKRCTTRCKHEQSVQQQASLPAAAAAISSSQADTLIRQGNPSANYHHPEFPELDASLPLASVDSWNVSPSSISKSRRYITRAGMRRKSQQQNQQSHSNNELDYFQGTLQQYQPPGVTLTAFTSSTTSTAKSKASSRGGASVAATGAVLGFWDNMICGAISRSVAQTVMHPANTMKTILQNPSRQESIISLLSPSKFRRLTMGAGANFLLSVPQGAVNFAVLEFVRHQLGNFVTVYGGGYEKQRQFGPALDFLSSAISTIACSVISTPQMMITDNIMAGNYPNLPAAAKGLWQQQSSLAGFYAGWWPGLVGKIPSYALTWTIFQQLKRIRDSIHPDRPATDLENSIMGCIASGTTVTLMIPMDTIKTRLVTQAARIGTGGVAYKGIIDCAVRVAREEGIMAFYRGLPPRLVSVMPMIGIQFGVYEFMRKALMQRKKDELKESLRVMTMTKNNPYSSSNKKKIEDGEYGRSEVLQEAAMEVAASPEHPFPAPRLLNRVGLSSADTANTKKRGKRKSAKQK